jgi:endonuclease YncB( thermonuclease family)
MAPLNITAHVFAVAPLAFALCAHVDTFDARVAHVVDGDTLDVIAAGKRIRVRILDIDAPEQKQPYGDQSRQSLIAICGGESAQLDGHKHDRSGRLLARVRCNGIDAGAEQVRQGNGPGIRAPRAGAVAALCYRGRSSRNTAWLMGYAAARAAVGVAPIVI